jgi:hypothetical protein
MFVPRYEYLKLSPRNDSTMQTSPTSEKLTQELSTLPVTFSRGGFDFEQLQRSGNVALFGKQRGAHRSFEVMMLERRTCRVVYGKICPAHEVLPPSSRWGQKGWTLMTLARAEAKFAEVVQMRRERPFLHERPAQEPFSRSPRVIGADHTPGRAAA